MRAMDTTAVVDQGRWLDGPDGRREADVLVTGTVDGTERRVLIECKDYNPATTGPVGIEVVDALESKRRDLETHVAMICSNSGFTVPAVDKAARTGIFLIGVMRKGDTRIRFLVHEPHYTRRVRVERIEVTLRSLGSLVKLPGDTFDSVRVDGAPLLNWVKTRAMHLISVNPVANGVLGQMGRLTSPVSIDTSDGARTIDEINFEMTITGGWYASDVTLDATAGLYDWLRRRVRLAPPGGELSITGIPFQGGEPVDMPPDAFLDRDIQEGEIRFGTLNIEGGAYLAIEGDVPKLDDLLHPDDVDALVRDIPAAVIRSSIPTTSPPPND